MNSLEIVNNMITILICILLSINIAIGFAKCEKNRFMYWFGILSMAALILELTRNVILK